MKKLNQFVLSFLLIFLFLINISYASPFDHTSFSCGSYSYYAPAYTYPCTDEWLTTYPITSPPCYMDCPLKIYYTSSGINWLKFNNAGKLLGYTYFNSSDIYINPSLTYYFTCAYGGGNWFSDAFKVPVYSGCATPILNVVNSYPSIIMNDRYRLNFTFDNIVGWNDVLCSLSLDGINHYGKSFNSNGSVDILYSSFPKEFTTAHVICSYSDASNNTQTFYDTEFLVDTAISYHISTPTLQPSHLYPFDTLNFITFSVVSDFDATPYPSSIKANLSTIDNLTDLNCSGSADITSNFPNANSYLFNPAIICDNPATIHFAINAYDQNTNDPLGYYPFTATWNNGNMVIDNVNLIRRNETGNLELWATISNDYTHNPINDGSSLSCVYSMESSDTYEIFSGNMAEVRTYGDYYNGSYQLIQTDMKNDTVDTTTSYNIGDNFEGWINCTANDYGNANLLIDKWIGARRLKTFKCNSYLSASMGFLQNTIYFSAPYQTNDIIVRCTVIPDTGSPQDSYLLILDNALGSGYSTTNLASNMNGGSFYGTCKDLVSGSTHINLNPQYTQSITFTTSLHQWDDACANLQQLQAGKISRDLVSWMMTDTATSTNTFNATITPVRAHLTFDIAPLPFATVTKVTLAFTYNKTANPNIIENNDQMVCLTAIYDPSSTVQEVQNTYFNTDDPNGALSSCADQHISKQSLGNGSYVYASYLKVNSTSCPFFTKTNFTGHLVCNSKVYQIGQSTYRVYASNEVLFKTTTTSTVSVNGLAILGQIGDAFSPYLDMGLAFFTSNPLMFLFVVFLFVAFIIALVVFTKLIQTADNVINRRKGGE